MQRMEGSNSGRISCQDELAAEKVNELVKEQMMGRGDDERTWCETNTVNGPTSAKKPICPVKNIIFRSSCLSKQSWRVSHLIDVVHNAINDLPFEWFENDCSISCHKFCLPTTWQHDAAPYVQDRHNGDDITELTRACPFNVSVELRLQELQHSRPEERRVKKDGVREFFLPIRRC